MSSPEDLVAEAEKKANPSFFAKLTKGANYDEASELFTQAANQYKLKGMWNEASKCYQKAAAMQAQMNDKTQEAHLYIEAGHVLRKLSVNMASDQYKLACTILTSSGRFAQAARLMKTIAEEYEASEALEEALKYYKQAADYYALDEYGKSSYSQCIIKYAELIARLHQEYDSAIKIFEDEGANATKNALLQYGAKEHWLKAGILNLVKGDSITASVSCDQYMKMDSKFEGSREGKLLKSICVAYENHDTDTFVTAIAEYDNITRLDPWKVFFLSQIKATMPAVDASDNTQHIDHDFVDTSNIPKVTNPTGDGHEFDLT